MLPAKRQKIDRESTAAYIASQPLFDALRNATKAVADQKTLLKAARDTVQALHVKVINDDSDQHMEYMHNILNAWIGATQSYHDIFRQLAILTAEEPSVGREAAPLHGPFVAMLETAREANKLAQDVMDGKDDDDDDDVKEAASEEGETGVKKEEESDSASESAPEIKSSKSTATTLATGPRKRPFVEDESADEGASKASKASKADDTPNSKLEKKPKNKNAKARRKAAKDAAITTSTDKAQPDPVFRQQAPSLPAMKSEAKDDAAAVPPAVEYEDLAPQVEARLKEKAAKADAKKARRAEKKRKRESGDSFVKDDDDEVKTEPKVTLPAAKQEQTEKPKKKKVKKVHDEVAGGTIATTSAASTKPEDAVPKTSGLPSGAKASQKGEKRRPSVDTAAVQGGGGKKRKTKHAA